MNDCALLFVFDSPSLYLNYYPHNKVLTVAPLRLPFSPFPGKQLSVALTIACGASTFLPCEPIMCFFKSTLRGKGDGPQGNASKGATRRLALPLLL